jgi:hypothetical protein
MFKKILLGSLATVIFSPTLLWAGNASAIDTNKSNDGQSFSSGVQSVEDYRDNVSENLKAKKKKPGKKTGQPPKKPAHPPRPPR